ncbi:MAG TPA: RDD family protein [Gammaproteobacteria bacterium]
MLRLDTVHTFETPEGVELGLRVAGPLPRALAWLIDALIRYFALAIVSLALLPLGLLGGGLILILLFLMEWFYPVLFEVKRGATPGKRAMGLTVVHDNGTPIGWPASLIRNLLRVIDFFPLLYGAGLLSMLINRQFKRLGDLAAGTLVVYVERARRGNHTISAAPRALPTPLAVEEQRALLDFAERSTTLAPARVEELAELLSDERGPAAVQCVLGYAHWLTRGK